MTDIFEVPIPDSDLLKKAEQDSVVVEENEVNLALDQQIQMLSTISLYLASIIFS